jgi:GT2 family glycosyltransferase
LASDLSVVIVSWNTRELLRACLGSVFENACNLTVEVFVLDNASSDGSAAMVREHFPRVRLIENRNNVGFAAANNQVFPHCSADFVLLLNSDTVIIDSALQILVDFMQANPMAGAVGPRLLHPRLKMRVLGCGHQPTLWREFNHQFGISRLVPHSRLFRGIHLFVGVHDDKVREVEWISGAALLVRNQVIKSVGGLNEQWFMYAEDMEWCRRIGAAGWKLYSVPYAVVEHHLSASTKQNENGLMLSVTAGRSYFVFSQRPSALKLFLFDLVTIAGMLLRAIGFFLCSLTDRRHADMWRSRARLFARYAMAHTRIAVGKQKAINSTAAQRPQ